LYCVKYVPHFFRYEIAGSNGLSNAESLAKLAAVMAQKGEFNGVRIIEEDAWKNSMTINPIELDVVLGLNFSRTDGGFSEVDFGDGCFSYGWCGYGGSTIFWDPKLELGYSYVMSAATPQLWGGRGFELSALTSKILKKQLQS